MDRSRARVSLFAALLVLATGGGACTRGSDGDADADGDVDGDADTDVDGDADADTDADADADSDVDGDVDGDADADAECAEGESRCGPEGVETCRDGVFEPTEPCPQGCADGACSEGAVACAPGETRCFRSSVERCNRTGTAWLHDSVCDGGCAAGLCLGRCTPGEARCNGDDRERCAAGGDSWTLDEVCPLGCERGVCVEDALRLPGTVVDLAGVHVYAGCVEVDLGGSLRVPAGETLELWARCLTLAPSATISLGASARLRAHLSETADLEGDATGGAEVLVEAYEAMAVSGTVRSDRVVLRADRLDLEPTGVVAGTSLGALLYGESLSVEGSHSGTTSVMPPSPLESPTHPSAGVWNLSDDAVVVAWDRPFPSALGYYVAVGDEVPGPGRGELRTHEHVTIPASRFGPGEHRVRATSVNPDSVVGTFPEDLVLRFNVRPPRVESASHPVEGAWGGPDDVHLSWTDPEGAPAGTWTGYLYAWDRQADTRPGLADHWDDRTSLLLPDQAPGIWFFHIVNVDRLGRPSPVVEHREVRIGPDPGRGNVAGTVTDAATGAPVAGATARLNGGLLRAVSGETGDYTFLGEVPAATEAYRLTVSAPGYLTAEATVTVSAGAAEVVHVALEPDPAGPRSLCRVGWEVRLSDSFAGNHSIAMGPRGRAIWARAGGFRTDEQVAVIRSTGELLATEDTLDAYSIGARTEVGWSGDRFFALEDYQCRDDGSLAYGHGWTCLRMRTWSGAGEVLHGWLAYATAGHTGSPSVAWNGDGFGTFFVSYSALYHREITPDLRFADGLGPTAADPLATGYYDTRERARTRAVWDGDGYALAFIIGAPSTATSTLYFGRWARDAGRLLAPVAVDPAPPSTIGLVEAGGRYHISHVRQSGPDRDLVLRAVDPGGSLGPATPLVLRAESNLTEPSMAFDGRSLLVAYAAGPAGDEAVLELRSPADHSLLETHDLGHAVQPRVAASPATGEALVTYTRTDRPGTYLRPLFLD